MISCLLGYPKDKFGPKDFYIIWFSNLVT